MQNNSAPAPGRAVVPSLSIRAFSDVWHFNPFPPPTTVTQLTLVQEKEERTRTHDIAAFIRMKAASTGRAPVPAPAPAPAPGRAPAPAPAPAPDMHGHASVASASASHCLNDRATKTVHSNGLDQSSMIRIRPPPEEDAHTISRPFFFNTAAAAATDLTPAPAHGMHGRATDAPASASHNHLNDHDSVIECCSNYYWNVATQEGPSSALDQSSMINIKPLPEEDVHMISWFKRIRRSRCSAVFVLFSSLLMVLAFILYFRRSDDTAKTALTVFVVVGVIIFFAAVIVFANLFHTDEITVTETRYVRERGKRCDFLCLHLILTSEVEQYNMDFLTGVELRTRTNSCALYFATILLLAASCVAYFLPPYFSIYEGLLIALLGSGLLSYLVYFCMVTLRRRAFVRASFSSGLQPESESGDQTECLIAYLKRICFRYPVYEDSIVLPLAAGGLLYRTLSSCRLRAAARLEAL
jgi:hypothetical protein